MAAGLLVPAWLRVNLKSCSMSCLRIGLGQQLLMHEGGTSTSVAPLSFQTEY